MPRGRKRIVDSKDYDALIASETEAIEKLTTTLKDRKNNLKQLKKDKLIFEKQQEEERKSKEMAEIVDMINNSGKSMDDIKQFLENEKKVEKK